MRLRSAAAATFFVVSILSLSACGSHPGASNIASNAVDPTTVNTNSARTNLEDLSLLVTMPYEAEDIVWKEDKSSKTLVAVLRFDQIDTNKLVADVEKFGTATDATLETETWFPDELTAQSDLKGNTALNGKTYPANPFFLDPYNSGKLTRIEGTDFFVLELNGK